MEFVAKSSLSEKQKSACLITSQNGHTRLAPCLEKLPKESQKLLKDRLAKGDISQQIGAHTLFYDLPGIERLLIVGVGEKKSLSERQFRDIIISLTKALANTGAMEASIMLEDFSIQERDNAWKIRQAIEIFHAQLYKFEKFKNHKKHSKRPLRRFIFLVSKNTLKACEKACIEAEAIVAGVEVVKNLANTPPNVCTPSFLADYAKQFAKKHSKVSAAVLEEKDMAALKMGLLLSVTSGSKSAAKLITLEYRGGKKGDKPFVFVGKGITFDTGGNTIKIPPFMIGMKYDMSGAAAVLGILEAAVRLGLPFNIIGVIPSCENMPGPTATRPEDIVTSMSGMTVEILNTDAEGRLILADALTYCERFNPEIVIDIATLTSACFLALGYQGGAMMTHDNDLSKDLMAASVKSGDKIWPLPLWEEYEEALYSEFADIANVPFVDVGARSIIAGCFLSKFTQNYRWAHLDVANVAAGLNKSRGATGRPVPLLVQFLLDRL